MQRNWIGRSTGADVVFEIEGRDEPVTIYTTRPDTLYGATFFVVAADSDLAAELAAGSPAEQEFGEYVEKVGGESEIERLSTDREKTGVFLHRYAINPVNGERLPIWASDYVLADYGHGAIMAVPAHDQRDLDFARTFDLPVRVVVDTGDEDPAVTGAATTGDGVMVNSGPLDGLRQGGGDRPHHRDPGRARAGAGDGQLPAARLADLAAALLGHADPDHPLPDVRRGPGRRTTSCRSRCPRRRAWTCGRRARHRWARQRTGSTSAARAAVVRRTATPTRWTRSSTRRGTSCASAPSTETTFRSTPTMWLAGCPSTSTSAA